MCKRETHNRGHLLFLELPSPDDLDTLNARYCLAIVHVSAEFLVAVDCQAFLKSELEPIPACDTVARPIVEVLMPNDTLFVSPSSVISLHAREERRNLTHTVVISIAGRNRIGKDAGGVEHIQTLVLHGSHVERLHGCEYRQVLVEQ